MTNVDNSLENYYAYHRAPVVVHRNGNKREIGRVFAVYKDKLVIIDGENRKEHEYLIPKSKIHHYGNNQIYLNLAENSLKDFEI